MYTPLLWDGLVVGILLERGWYVVEAPFTGNIGDTGPGCDPLPFVDLHIVHNGVHTVVVVLIVVHHLIPSIK